MDLQISGRFAAMLLQRIASRATLIDAAQRSESAVRQLFLRAVRNAQNEVSLATIADAVHLPGTGAISYIFEPAFQALTDTLIDDVQTHAHAPFRQAKDSTKLPQILLKAYKAGGHVAALQLETSFDTTNPAAIEWAQAHAAELVVEINAQARLAIRSAITEGFTNGISPEATAKLLRSVVGLTERDAIAVMRRHIKLLSEGVSSREASKRAEQYATKLLRTRTKTIAINETMTASNEGQRELWRQAAKSGLLDGNERKTIIQADPCPICTQVSGEEVRIFEEFSIGLPPFHVRCRCTEGLI